MKFLNSQIIKYGLHDCKINKIKCDLYGLHLLFNGIYFTDGDGKELTLTKECSMDIKIAYFDVSKIYEHITIKKISNRRITEISFKTLEKMLDDNCINVYLDYYSDFAKSIMIIGTIGKYEIEFIVTEITDIQFIFNS